MLGNISRFDVNDNTPPTGREATLVGTADRPARRSRSRSGPS